MTAARRGAWLVGIAVALLLAAPGGAAAAEPPSDEAVCPVCAHREGTLVPEPVRAVREVDGVRYGFCSKACAAEFDRDPELYRAAGAGADSFHVAPLVDFGATRVATAPT